MLKQILKEARIYQDDLMKVTGIGSHRTICFKINGKARFYLDEAIAIRDYIYAKTGKKYKLEDLFK